MNRDNIAQMELAPEGVKGPPPAYPDPPPYQPDTFKTLSICHSGLTRRDSVIKTSSPHSPVIIDSNVPEKTVYYSDVSFWTLGKAALTLHRGGSAAGPVVAMVQFPYPSMDLKFGIVRGNCQDADSEDYHNLGSRPSTWWERAYPPSEAKNFFWSLSGLPGYSRGELAFGVPRVMLSGSLERLNTPRIKFIWKRTHHDHMTVPNQDPEALSEGSDETSGAGRSRRSEGGDAYAQGNLGTPQHSSQQRQRRGRSATCPDDQTTSNRIPMDSFKLVCEHDSSIVVAQFRSKSCFEFSLQNRGQLVFRTDLAAGPEWEAIVLVTLLGMLEKARRRQTASRQGGIKLPASTGGTVF